MRLHSNTNIEDRPRVISHGRPLPMQRSVGIRSGLYKQACWRTATSEGDTVSFETPNVDFVAMWHVPDGFSAAISSTKELLLMPLR